MFKLSSPIQGNLLNTVKMRSLDSLSDFIPCPEGDITLCEVDGRLHSMKHEYANISAFTNAVSWVI